MDRLSDFDPHRDLPRLHPSKKEKKLLKKLPKNWYIDTPEKGKFAACFFLRKSLDAKENVSYLSKKWRDCIADAVNDAIKENKDFLGL